MKRKVLRGLLPAVLVAAWLTGCGGADGETGAQDAQTPAADQAASSEEQSNEADGETATDEAYLVGFANNSDTYNYCAKFRSYLKEETEAKGIQIMVTDAAGDTNVQNGQVDDFIVQNAKVVSAISNDLDGSVPALEAAKAAGIPYISFLTTVTGGMITKAISMWVRLIQMPARRREIIYVRCFPKTQRFCILPVSPMTSSI